MNIHYVNKSHTATVCDEFIQHRNYRAKELDRKKDGADCEFAEWFLAKTSGFKQSSGKDRFIWDLEIPNFGKVDFKLWAPNLDNGSVYLSNHVIKHIKQELLDNILVWDWDKPNWTPPLYAGQKVTIRYLAFIHVTEIKKHLKANSNRLSFPWTKNKLRH